MFVCTNLLKSIQCYVLPGRPIRHTPGGISTISCEHTRHLTGAFGSFLRKCWRGKFMHATWTHVSILIRLWCIYHVKYMVLGTPRNPLIQSWWGGEGELRRQVMISLLLAILWIKKDYWRSPPPPPSPSPPFHRNRMSKFLAVSIQIYAIA